MYGIQQPGTDGEKPTSTRGIYGDSGVHYDEGGRLIYPGQQQDPRGPTNRLFWRGGDPSQAAGPTNFRYRPWNRTVVNDPSTGPIIPRRVDGVQAGPINRGFQPSVIDELPYTPASRLGGLPVTGIDPIMQTAVAAPSSRPKTTMSPETIIIEEMRVYDDKPCCFWLHLVVGILMIGVGVANIIVCFDYLYYCYIWTGIAVFIFAITCRIHGGDYIEKKWKSVLLIAMGFVATTLESACVYLVIVSFSFNAISLAEVGTDVYVETWKFRYAYYNITPMVTINNDYKYNLFVCFALNAFQIVLLMASFVVLSTTLVVIDRFYNSYFTISRKVDPFCEPWLFNPWGQCSLGQAMIIIGTFVGATEHGEDITNWAEVYSPVWAGIIPILAGIAAALSLKTCEKGRRWEHWLAIGLEVVSLVGSLVSDVLMLLDLNDNIISLTTTEGGVMLNTTWDRTLITVSVIFRGCGIIISTVNIFYSGTLIFRVLVCICSNLYANTDDTDDKRYVLEDSGIFDDNSAQKTSQQRQAEAITAATTYNTGNNQNIPVFSAYRPMGTRSFYA